MACKEEDPKIPDLDAPALLSSVPEDGAEELTPGDLAILLTFDQNITCPSSSHSSITINDASINRVFASMKEVLINVSGLEESKNYNLVIPEDFIFGSTKVGEKETKISFSTREAANENITTELVTETPSPEAQNVYDFLLDNYGKKIISADISNVALNTNEAEWVKQHTGEYPAMTTVDYIFVHYSPANWIDYNNIDFIEDWWNNNGLFSASWHWNVPIAQGSEDYAFYSENNNFSTANAIVEGTWENNVIKADLEELSGYLTLLKEKNIPVIWRPLHEASRNIYEYQDGTTWFWWGADGAEAYKKLWIYMFDYFEEQGLNNLIWVWTTQTKDNAFYPGDEYVDIVGIYI